MTTTALIAYAAAMLIAAATPGPSMLVVLSTGISRGTLPATIAGLGIALSDVVLVTLALAGLAALASTYALMFAAVKYAGAAYLIYLGIRMWRARPEMLAENTTGPKGPLRSLGLGLAVGLGNPKAILFHASLMPILLDIRSLRLLDAVAVCAVALIVNIVVMSSYAAIAGRSSRFFQSRKRLRWMNRIAGGMMVGTGSAIAMR